MVKKIMSDKNASILKIYSIPVILIHGMYILWKMSMTIQIVCDMLRKNMNQFYFTFDIFTKMNSQFLKRKVDISKSYKYLVLSCTQKKQH